MLIIVEKDSAQSNDSSQNGIQKRSDTLPSDRYFNIHLHIIAYSRPTERCRAGTIKDTKQVFLKVIGTLVQNILESI